jgi:hypothetical protein
MSIEVMVIAVVVEVAIYFVVSLILGDSNPGEVLKRRG